MPTIDELAAAVSVSDSDELVVSQSDVARKATRGQLLAGVQPALAVAQGFLLGRVSAGTGTPESIAIGANLTVANATLSAPAAYSVAGQTIGAAPQAGDLVAMAQGGQNAAVTYATFASGLAGVPGIDGSGFVAAPAGGVGARPLAGLFGDAITVESFGAVGDGQTDDTAAFNAALASGRTLRLDSRVYAIGGAVTVAQSVAAIGVPGQTVLRRTGAAAAGAWMTVTAARFAALGVIFDAGGLAATDAPALGVSSGCAAAQFVDCQFINARGSDQGHGLLVDAAAAVVTVQGCAFTGNGADGFHAATAAQVVAQDCTATLNAGFGIMVGAGIACCVARSNCSSNQTGIAVGNWQNAAPLGQATPGVSLWGNSCSNNALWGIAAAGTGVSLSNNTLTGNGNPSQGGGMVCRVASGRIIGNRVDAGAIGVDARSCYGSVFTGNQISSTGIGIEAGASQNVLLTGNFLLQNAWGIAVNAFEPSISALAAGPITIDGNWIGFTTALGGGVQILDGVQGASITDNDINGWGSAAPSQALHLHTDAAIVHGNRWNNTAQFSVQAGVVANQPSLVIPDGADRVLVTAAPPAVSSVLTLHQVDTLGQITFLRLLQGGSGYTEAQVVIAGSGTGAAAQAVCANGQVVGLIVTNPGSGYGGIGSAAAVTISGDGSGAAGSAFVGLPVLQGRTLQITCSAPLRLTINGSSPAQQSWSQYDLTVPAFGAADLVGAFGGWYAVQSPPVDYLAPTGNGGAVLQSVAGADIFLRPSAGGSLHIASGSEPLGCTSSVGRGAPTGVVAAPPGSDFRNLDGGTGTTFWIKCSGTDASGWVAVA